MKKILLTLMLLTMSLSASAATLTLSQLPESFVERIFQGDIQMSVFGDIVISDFETDGFAAYSYLTSSGFHYLLAYDVAAGSHWGNNFGSSTELSGNVFLGVSQFYDLNTDGHEIDLYFDQLIPDVASQFFFSGQPYTTVTLEAGAIASGQGVYEFSGDPEYLISGDMNFGSIFGSDAPLICIECRLSVVLNLVNLDFSTGFLIFDPDDPRTSLFAGQDSYVTTPYGWDLAINVTGVPVPGAFILFASAMLGLVRIKKSGVHI